MSDTAIGILCTIAAFAIAAAIGWGLTTGKFVDDFPVEEER